MSSGGAVHQEGTASGRDAPGSGDPVVAAGATARRGDACPRGLQGRRPARRGDDAGGVPSDGRGACASGGVGGRSDAGRAKDTAPVSAVRQQCGGTQDRRGATQW